MLTMSFGQSTEYLRAQIEKLIRNDLDVGVADVPGFIVGIIDGDKTYVIPFGERTQGLHDTINATDRFELGSVTKVFTAQLVLTLAADGQLDLQGQLNDYLPDAFRNPLVQTTIEDLLLHYSGLPKLPETLGQHQTDPDNPYADFGRQELLAWYRDLKPVTLGTFRYAHTGYAMLEIAMERMTGKTYSELIQEYFEVACEMSLTSTRDSGLTAGYDLAHRPADPWTFPTFGSSEGLRSSLSDLLKFATRILDQERITSELSNVQRVTDMRRILVSRGLYCILSGRDFPVWIHTGHTGGHAALIVLAPKTRTAVVVLSNSAAGTGELGLLILRTINNQWKRKK